MAKKSTLARVVTGVVSLSMCVVWTTVVAVRMLFQLCVHGRKYFVPKERTVEPKILTDGWQHDYVKLSEVKLHYVHAGSADKPLMLMLHGFPEFWFSWRAQIRDFEGQYHVVAVDQRGYSSSDHPENVSDYSVKKLSADIAELIPALGHKSCVLVAHDWGGVVAYKVATDYPQLVDKLVIMNAPHPEGFRKLVEKEGSLKQVLRSWYMFFFQSPYLPELAVKSDDFGMLDVVFKDIASITDEHIEAWKYVLSLPGALTGAINWYRASMRTRLLDPDDGSDAPKIGTPTLIIWGDKDTALMTRLAELSAESCSDVSVKYVEGVGHWVQQEAPEECTRLMREFLE